MLRTRFERLMRSDGFLAPVLTLISGTVIAHAVTAGALLVLTRLYSPDNFGVLGLFASIAYTFSVAMCLRFDVAIPLADDDQEAFDLLGLSTVSALTIATVLGVVLVAIPNRLIADFGLGSLAPYLWIIPIALFAIGLYSALQSWFVRRKQFGLIARTRVVQSLSAASLQIGAGAVSALSIWLILGFVVNSAAASVVLAWRLWRENLPLERNFSLQRCRATFYKFRAFPKYSIWEAIANSGSIQLPIILIGAMASATEVGYLMLAMSVIQAPMSLFGAAAAQVFASQAPAEARNGRLHTFTKGTVVGLLFTGALPLLLLGLLAPIVFPIIFGAEWTRSGVLVAWMTPWLVLQFLTSPISTILYVTENQRAALILQAFGLALRLACTWIGVRYTTGLASEAYALSGALFYGCYLFLILKLAKSHSDETSQRWQNKIDNKP